MTKRGKLWGEQMDTKGFTVMTKADELWEKYADFGAKMERDEFMSAIREYGAAVRKRDVDICDAEGDKSAGDHDAGGCYGCAAAIEREPLP